MSAPSSGWRWIADPVLVGQRPAALGDTVREREVPDVVQQSGGVGKLLLLLGHPDLLGHVAREPGDRGGVTRRALVADVERAHQSGEHAPRQRHVLLGAMAGALEQVGHVREREHGRQGERDPGVAELHRDRGAGDDEQDVEADAREMLDERRRSRTGRSPAKNARRVIAKITKLSVIATIAGDARRRGRTRTCATASLAIA